MLKINRSLKKTEKGLSKKPPRIINHLMPKAKMIKKVPKPIKMIRKMPNNPKTLKPTKKMLNKPKIRKDSTRKIPILSQSAKSINQEPPKNPNPTQKVANKCPTVTHRNNLPKVPPTPHSHHQQNRLITPGFLTRQRR